MKKGISIVLLGLATFALAASFLKPDDILKDTKKYDKKDVVVRGKVVNFKAKTSKAGNKYTTFDLQGEKSKIAVYYRDHLAKPPKDGNLVEVNGYFQAEKKVGDRVFKNEVDFSKKDGKKYGLKILD